MLLGQIHFTLHFFPEHPLCHVSASASLTHMHISSSTTIEEPQFSALPRHHSVKLFWQTGSNQSDDTGVGRRGPLQLALGSTCLKACVTDCTRMCLIPELCLNAYLQFVTFAYLSAWLPLFLLLQSISLWLLLFQHYTFIVLSICNSSQWLSFSFLSHSLSPSRIYDTQTAQLLSLLKTSRVLVSARVHIL